MPKHEPDPPHGSPALSPLPSGPERLAIVGIGASAGGLDAATKLMEALPSGTGMAFVLVQHLDPTQGSMMATLLQQHTALTVDEATGGMRVEPEHLYVIPPGSYLAVGEGALHLVPPPLRHGSRLPVDFLLQSMAEHYGARAACVILSGTGADGSEGLRAIAACGGLVVAQDPEEAGYAGMPRSAIQTGKVDLVLPVAKIPAALTRHRVMAGAAPAGDAGHKEAAREPPPEPTDIGMSDEPSGPWLAQVIELLQTQKGPDFTLYKPGTLQRRIERRVAMAGLPREDMAGYLERLRGDPAELEHLARDLLINVTSFFRDAGVFEHLAATTIPGLLANHPSEQPLRVWIAGCSTGEETYSLAMIFLERMEAAKLSIKLQLFASDVDADAVAFARDGVYPAAIETCVAPARLARFFSREQGGWRATPDLRAIIVFTVQDVLTDPPFSRLDMVSCRNLLIYLRPEAQERVIDRFHFALRDGGILLLGSAETVAGADPGFATVEKTERIYRRVGRSGAAARAEAGTVASRQPGRVRALATSALATPTMALSGLAVAPFRSVALAEIGRRMVTETYGPAAVLINAANETLFSLGPTERYLQPPPGHATHDVVAMARPGLRAKLRSAIDAARQTRARVVTGCRISSDGTGWSFNLEVHPVLEAGEEMLLVCFVEVAAPDKPAGPATVRGAPRLVADLERDLEAARTELRGIVHDLELSNEQQRAVNEEALSVNEEYQSTNEELVASKEELQSLNEELTALNSQLQETLERERTTADDLQNVLYSTNVATLFLDRALRIRFFTPTITSLFDLVPGDIGRKLAAFAALAPDVTLESDAQTVLAQLEPMEREIEGRDGVWFHRRILPYRAQVNRVEGVVITFTDITARKNVAKALEAAKLAAEIANAAKSRFLAAASHDLRQPLQTLVLLQTLLAKSVDGDKARGLMKRLDSTVGTMATMLDTLLDINEIEAGVIRADFATFPIGDVLERLRDEFAYHAEAKGLILRVMPCSLRVRSDLRLLEQILRNLLSNALKYCKVGRVLLGCRRHGAVLSVEVWDTGIGIAATELNAIFDEYYQIGNAARERSRGLGLGLSIVRQLGGLLDHPIHVRSRRNKGSVFSVEVPIAAGGVGRAVQRELAKRVRRIAAAPAARQPASTGEPATASPRSILIIEDDPDLRELLEQSLTHEGHRVTTAPDGPAALACAVRAAPDLVLADYNLPNGPNGLEVAASIRHVIGRMVPVLILTGDMSTETKGAIERSGYVQFTKPVKHAALLETIERLVPAGQRQAAPLPAAAPPAVFVVDDDDTVRDALVAIVEQSGRVAAGYASSESFLADYRPGGESCLLVDAYLPGLDGIGLLERLRAGGDLLPAIMITGQSDVPIAVRAMKAGASDFVEKPVGGSDLLTRIDRALEQAHDSTKLSAWRKDAAAQLAGLTLRQRQVMTLVLAGQPSKNIAVDLGISQRTVENHRASIMHKTGAASLPALARLALAAASGDDTAALVRAAAL